MTSLRVRTVEPAIPTLGKADWIGAALNCLVSEGVEAVQITRLAKALGVTRGSFYWHFTDRQNLLDCVLDEWRAANLPVIEQELAKAASLSEGILAFFAIWEINPQFSAHLDHAVRDWARLDEGVLDIVRREDAQRIGTIAELFQRFGFEEDEAEVRARVLYFAQVGYHAMDFGDSIKQRLARLEHYYLSFTGQELDNNEAERFRQLMGDLS
ncbi:MAG: TetR/AcrR family transcriptional regulator [Rhizobiaceae bacterium]|nr:TetR/AcrR family transcriptional regulator [Hyphomicrobiales bacterium]NRB32492.1 TetR/AcrR family transcriptional regulator [Rhizobiaceae bacterium]